MQECNQNGRTLYNFQAWITSKSMTLREYHLLHTFLNEEFNSEENLEERVPVLSKEEKVAIELFEPSWGITVILKGVLGDPKVLI